MKRGFAADVDVAAMPGVGACVPVLSGDAFVGRPP
jgi:hypothetical protein